MSETITSVNLEDRLTKVSSVLITQARPTDDKSPYFELERKYNVKVDFRPFIEVRGIAYKDFRKQKVNILEACIILKK